MEINIKDGYKVTEVGVIPDDWDCELLKGKISITHGFGFKSQYFNSHGLYSLTTPGHFYEEGGFRELGEKQKYYNGVFPDGYLLQTGDLIIAMTEQADGLLGSAAIIPESGKYLHNQRLGKIKLISPDINLGFLYYIFNSKKFRLNVCETATGTKVKHTSPNRLLEINVPLPPLSEQKAIAHALSDVDNLITAIDQLITKKRNIKQGTMQQLLTGKKRLPGFSGEWEVKELKSILKLTNGFAFKSEFFSKNGPIVLTPGNFKLEGGLYFNERNTKRYCGNFPLSTQFNYGDLLVVMTDLTKECNLLGKPAFVNLREKILHNQRIGKIEILKEEVLKEFLFYFFLSYQYHLKIKESATGSTVRHTSPKSIYAIPIPLPSLPEQKAISKILSDIDKEIEALEKNRDKYKAIKQGMMQELLTGKTRIIDN